MTNKKRKKSPWYDYDNPDDRDDYESDDEDDKEYNNLIGV